MVFQDLKDKKRRKDVLLSDGLQGSHQLVITSLLVSEVSKGLDPKVAIHLIILRSKCMTLAYLQYFLTILLLDVEVEEFLFEVVDLTACLDAIFRVIDLEEEKHVVLVDLLLLSDQVVD